jgi:hypothetical protein
VVILLLVDLAAALFFGQYATRVGREPKSPTLIAEGRHRQVDVLSSAVVSIFTLMDYLHLGFSIFGITYLRKLKPAPVTRISIPCHSTGVMFPIILSYCIPLQFARSVLLSPLGDAGDHRKAGAVARGVPKSPAEAGLDHGR